MTEDDEIKVKKIVAAVVKKFRVYGGGQVPSGSEMNPIALALMNGPFVLAVGEDVEKIVRFVMVEDRRL